MGRSERPPDAELQDAVGPRRRQFVVSSTAMAKIPINPNMTLNARQEAFCRGLAEGKTQQRAYREAGYSGMDNLGGKARRFHHPRQVHRLRRQVRRSAQVRGPRQNHRTAKVARRFADRRPSGTTSDGSGLVLDLRQNAIRLGDHPWQIVIVLIVPSSLGSFPNCCQRGPPFFYLGRTPGSSADLNQDVAQIGLRVPPVYRHALAGTGSCSAN